MNDHSVYVRIKVRLGEHGEGVESELRIDEREVIEGILFRAAGRGGGAGWELARDYLWLATQNTLLEWAQKAMAQRIQQLRTPAEVMACALADHERRQPVDSEPDEA